MEGIQTLNFYNKYMDIVLYNKLKEIGTFDKKNLPKPTYLKKTLPEKYPELYKEFIETSPFTDNLYEKIYLLTHERGRCSICGNFTKFMSCSKGYKKTCSKECSNESVGLHTSKNLRGRKRPKEVFDKMKETRKKNGSVNKIRESLQKTNTEKYDVNSYFKTPEFKRKSLITLQNKWETNLDINYLCSLEYDMAKNLIYLFSRTKGRVDKDVIPDFDYHKYRGIYYPIPEKSTSTRHYFYSFKCLKCNHTFEDHLAKGHIPKCPICYPPAISKGENFLAKFFTKNNIEFKDQKRFPGLVGRNGGPLKFDFYLPEYNLCIEYQGIQHYGPQYYFGKEKFQEKYEELIENDQKKRDYCKENEISLLEIKYDIPLKNLPNRLKEILSKDFLKNPCHIFLSEKEKEIEPYY